MISLQKTILQGGARRDDAGWTGILSDSCFTNVIFSFLLIYQVISSSFFMVYTSEKSEILMSSMIRSMSKLVKY